MFRRSVQGGSIMRIQHNIAALNAQRNLMNNNSSVSKNLEKLSSGYRINRAGDDAAGLALSEKMRAQITGLTMAKKNAQDGIAMIQTAEGALNEVQSMLDRMVELATQSANGIYEDNVDRKAMQDEIDALESEIERIASATTFNGTTLFGGNLSVSIHIGYGADDFNKLKLSTAQLSKTGIQISSATSAAQAISTIKQKINDISTVRGSLGALQNRLEHTINNLGTNIENMTSAESRIRDVDIAEEMMAYTKNNILVQSAQAMLAQANQVPQGVLQLMQ
jgi:flagellin